MWAQSLGQEDSLEMGRKIHSRILAWKISWTEELGELQFMGWDTTEQACTALISVTITSVSPQIIRH